jgi:glycine/D-amino acid oxidase-like deaminating enzyme
VKVAVIGAGVIGASVARELARRGDDVTVVESGLPGAGTTSTSFAWVNANTKEPLDYFELNRAGMRAHRLLAQEADEAPWWFPTGNLEWATDGGGVERLDARVSRLRERAYDVRRLSVGEVAALEPDVDVPDGCSPVFFGEEGHCLPMVLLAFLLGQARDNGARVRTGSRVVAVEECADGVRLHVDGSGAEPVTADAVVCCAGRWTAELADVVPMLGPQNQESATLGYLATTSPVPVRLSRILTTPSLNVRPAGGGRLLLQALDLDPVSPPRSIPGGDSDIARTMLARVAAVLPGAKGALVEHLELGRRAMPADGRTVSGFVPHSERTYVVVTHSGITLGPLLGGLVAEELHGRPVELLAPFRPDRFRTASAVCSAPAQPRLAGEQ